METNVNIVTFFLIQQGIINNTKYTIKGQFSLYTLVCLKIL